MPPATPAQQRLASQLLVRPARAEPQDVVRHLGAMQAQDYSQALWAIASRLRDCSVTNVTQAIEERVILRTWPMRGTIHFIPAADAAWMLQVSTDRTVAAQATRLAQLELDAAVLKRCHGLLRRSLAGGARVTRPRLMQELEDAGVRTGGQRGYTVLWHAAHSGLICFGPMEGKQQTFVLLEEWAPGVRAGNRDEAVARLALRYFTSHGPATVHDFAWWAAITVTDAKCAVAALGSDLASRQIDGATHWSGPRPATRASAGAHLLAGFDELLLGYKDRTAVLPAEYAQRIVPGGNGVFQPTMVLDGRVVGTWRRTVGAKSVAVELVPFEEVSGMDAFQFQAERFAAYLGLPLAAVTVGAAGVRD